ncbi:response regulator transcription factor [Lacrimispora sp.]|uniref:response regulator transcription factor n=1 Tax=Lacrimispora sp. TaxID=2719234 RepID=UPI002FD8AC35
MYKVLLVDDEEMEREAMAETIPWGKVGMELADMAWNGIEALEKIRTHQPDIVITDIKMPVMDGIELIRKVRDLYPDIFFVVLSGYGEYEYTSKAMELEIRHYILKPCDVDKIVEVLLNVKKELLIREEKLKSEREYQSSIQRMVPHIKERILFELITKKELSVSDKILLANFTEDLADDFILLSVRTPNEYDQLDRFALTNILTELIGEDQVYMSAGLKKEIVYLLPGRLAEQLKPLIAKVHNEYYKYKKIRLCSAVSKGGRLQECFQLYCQIQELFDFGSLEEKREFFRYEMYEGEPEGSFMTVDYTRIQNAKNIEELMFEIYCSFIKMEIQEIPLERMAEVYSFVLKVLFGEEKELKGSSHVWELLEQVIEQCAFHMNFAFPDTKDGKRMKKILYMIYRNIKNPDLNLQYMAQHVLFMNEDYLGRFFAKNMNQRFSAFLVRIRICLVQRILAFQPDMRVSQLAEQTGYPSDGQYLTKVFKKHTGMVLSEYRRYIKKNRGEDAE